MRLNTIQRRKARGAFEQTLGKAELISRMYQMIKTGKQGLDGFIQELGTLLVEAIMEMERQERSGPQYQPVREGVYKWAYQKGSLYMGDRKISVRHPRLRGPKGEIPLESYETLKKPGAFSEELLNKVLRGISARKYWETLMETAGAFGVSPGTVSRHVVEVTVQRLKEFKERALSGIVPFTVFIDTIHRGEKPSWLPSGSISKVISTFWVSGREQQRTMRFVKNFSRIWNGEVLGFQGRSSGSPMEEKGSSRHSKTDMGRSLSTRGVRSIRIVTFRAIGPRSTGSKPTDGLRLLWNKPIMKTQSACSQSLRNG